MRRTRSLVALVLSTSLFACDCKDEEACTVPTVTPASARVVVCQEGDGRLVLEGTGFTDDTVVRLVAGATELEATSVDANDDGTRLVAQLPTGALAGTTYDVVVENGSCVDVEPHATVAAASGAFAFLADPDVVYDGISTNVTVYATSLELPLPTDAVQIAPDGVGTPSTSLTWAPVAGRPNRVQVVVPQGQAVGTYDLSLTDGLGCRTTIDQAVRVTSSLTVSLDAVDPPFGDVAEYTSLTLKRDTAAAAPADAPFVATPRLFLNPSTSSGGTVAIALQSVSFVDADTLTAVVPPGQPQGVYDVIVVNPDGTVGRLEAAYRVQAAPPTVDTATPSSVVAASGQQVVLAGRNFATGAAVTAACRTPVGGAVTPTVTTAAPMCGGAACSVTATIDASVLASGDVCVLRLTNPDGAYFEYSAIGVTNSSLNLSAPRAGTLLTKGRRALVALSGNATASSRFVFVLGGDAGTNAGAFSDVEAAPVDAYGTLGAFVARPESPLRVARTRAAGVTIGRYLYVVGGFDGTNALASAERALVLDPVEVPRIDVADMLLEDTGLDPGSYVYRVSAVFGANDVDNPGGESLPSDEFVVRVPTVDGKKIQVVLSIDPPVDRLGQPIPGVVGYRVYRSPMAGGRSGDARLLSTLGTGVTTFTDDGSLTAGTEAPLAIGSLGKFAPLPDLGTARVSLGVAAGRDPAAPSTWYLYAAFGTDANGMPNGTYEYLSITAQPNGHQTLGSAWVAGTSTSSAPRSEIGTWTADSTVSGLVTPGTTFVYFGGGRTSPGTLDGRVEVGRITEGGALASIDDGPKDFASNRSGYGVCAANGQLFAFGGAGGSPSAGAIAAVMEAPAPSLTNNSWNNEGLSMTNLRYLMGSTVQSAFIFLVGGQTDTAAASRTTELVIW